MAPRPRIRLRSTSTSSPVARLAAAGKWEDLPPDLTREDLETLAYSVDGYGVAAEWLAEEAFEVAKQLVARHRTSGLWGGTTTELLVAFFATVRSWRGLLGDPSREDLELARALFEALRERRRRFPHEVEFVPAPSDAKLGVRTSSSHPLRVDWLKTPGPWRVGITIAPGKCTDATGGFRWARELGADLAQLEADRVHTLVCLLETDEMLRLGIPDLVAAARARGIDAIHVPIPDLSVPSVEAAQSLVSALLAREGLPIVIHCNGGLGRSGLVAGCLLRGLGMSAEDALTRLREARGSDCPQTSEQRAFVASFEPRPAQVAGPSRSLDPRLRSRIRGSLLGGAVGDALGAPIEFASIDEIRRRYGPEGLEELAPAYGRVGAITDDTQMTLFTAEGLLRAEVRSALKGICHPPAIIHRAYLRWLRTQGETSRHPLFGDEPDGWLIGVRGLWSQRAPGNTCLAALKANPADLWAENTSKGCGGIMRVAPVGLVVPPGSASGPWGAFDLGADAARLTHGHPAGYLSAGYFAELIAQVLAGKALREAIDLAREPLTRRDGADAVLLAVDRALRLAEREERPSPEGLATLGGAWVGEEALAIALYCALAARDFAHGVRLAVNHSGDSDSTGSLVGNLLGAIWGEEAIPARWLELLELRAEIEAISDDLTKLSTGTFDPSAKAMRYPGW